MNTSISEAAIKLLRYRPYSKYELEQKLLNQGYGQAAVNQAIEYVVERGYLNDTALCDMLLTKYAEVSKYSLKEVYIKLRRRGLSSALIKERLADWDEMLEYQAAMNLAAKVLARDSSRDMRKIIRHLSGKGFKATTVTKVLERLRDMSP